MGTRGIVVVVKDEEYKIAKYNHSDSYPNGLGNDLCDFIQSIKESGQWETFIKRLDKTRRSKEDEDESEILDARGTYILGCLLEEEAQEYILSDDLAFAGASLFCEWGYVIDCDNSTMEVYRGFQETIDKEGRFAFLGDDMDEYKPIHLVRTYSLDALPNVEELTELEQRD